MYLYQKIQAVKSSHIELTLREGNFVGNFDGLNVG